MPKQPVKPHTTAATDRQAAERRERLAAELRANLGRRKAQLRERDDDAKIPEKDDALP